MDAHDWFVVAEYIALLVVVFGAVHWLRGR